MEDLQYWLKTFAKCVQTLDYDSGRQMFLKDVICFGSKASILQGIDDLIERQWKKIWPNITGFEFLLDHAHYEVSQDGNLACVVAPWTSTGYDLQGRSYPRPGRVTILLHRAPQTGRWLAKHTHYSLYPGTPMKTVRSPSPSS